MICMLQLTHAHDVANTASIDLFFERIHTFLPIFHKPSFYSHYVQKDDDGRYRNLTKADALVIYGMIALAARFSPSSWFQEIPVKDRGKQFAALAQDMCDGTVRSGPFTASLLWVQGIILYAYYIQTEKPGPGCDLAICALVRWAYELALHRTDEIDPTMHSTASEQEKSQQWLSREERRRAWWAIWELDTYDSITSRRPFLISRDHFQVHLPSSDEAWFAGTPVASGPLHPQPMTCWKVLRDMENQCERAWFLVSNHIATHTLQLCQQRNVEQKRLANTQTALSCFALLFHEALSNPTRPQYHDTPRPNRTWIILTQLMIHM